MQGPGGPTLFVGRVHEVQRLQRGFETAMRGQGSVALLAGEPGIGKTTVCRDLAAWVTDRGGFALLGQCDDAGVLSVPYLPFIETLTTAVRARGPADLVREVGPSASDLAQRVPDPRDRLPGVPMAAAPADPVDALYRLLQAVTGFLTAVAASVPILLILENLQDADRGTLDLFGHLSQHLADARILILGTFRTTEADHTHPLAQSIALARRRIGVIATRILFVVHAGRHEEVRAHLDEAVLARPDFGTDGDMTHQYIDVFRLEAAELVGHRPAAARLLERLAPLSHVTTGVRVPTCVGRHLGAAAAMLGRHDEALAHYQVALKQAQSMRFRPELALTRRGLAEHWANADILGFLQQMDALPALGAPSG